MIGITATCRSLAAKAKVVGMVSRRASSNRAIEEILDSVQRGQINPSEGAEAISSLTGPVSSTEQLLKQFADLDHSRAKRTGFPEAVFAEGKTPKQVFCILESLASNLIKGMANEEAKGLPVPAILATRVDPAMYEELKTMEYSSGSITYHEVARIVSMEPHGIETTAPKMEKSRVVVATAGTTDIPVAEEAAVTLEAAGCEVDRIYDAGVAGLHRIIKALPRLRDPSVSCVIVCAGMDGALPSVVGGLVNVPVFAVPCSIGYGASFGGVSAMLTMLNSCSPGVSVLNIDNGFGAAAIAFKAIRNRNT